LPTQPAGTTTDALRTPSPTEDVVLRVWRQVLGVHAIDVGDSFLDAGGSSLTAVQAISRIEEELGVKVAIEEFIFQTASQLATLCEQRRLQQQDLTAPAPAAPARGGLFRSLRSAIAGRS
jgi:acyl carrier protein